MRVLKCNRCGGIYDPNAIDYKSPKYIVRIDNIILGDTDLDLCPKCSALLEMFIDKHWPKEKDNGR